MKNIKELTGKDIHEIFCTLMECEPKENLTIKGFDSIAYFHILQDEEIEDNDIVSQYKEYENGNITMYINEEMLNIQPYSSLDVIVSQLFDLYADSFDYYMPAYMEANKLRFSKSAPSGYNYWYQFSSSYMSFSILHKIFDTAKVKDEEYSDAALKKKYMDILKDVPVNDAEIDIKISAILYILGRMSYFEELNSSMTISQFKKHELTNIEELIGGEAGENINNLYRIFVKSLISSLRVTDYMKINKMVKKIKTIIVGQVEK